MGLLEPCKANLTPNSLDTSHNRNYLNIFRLEGIDGVATRGGIVGGSIKRTHPHPDGSLRSRGAGPDSARDCEHGAEYGRHSSWSHSAADARGALHSATQPAH